MAWAICWPGRGSSTRPSPVTSEPSPLRRIISKRWAISRPRSANSAGWTSRNGCSSGCWRSAPIRRRRKWAWPPAVCWRAITGGAGRSMRHGCAARSPPQPPAALAGRAFAGAQPAAGRRARLGRYDPFSPLRPGAQGPGARVVLAAQPPLGRLLASQPDLDELFLLDSAPRRACARFLPAVGQRARRTGHRRRNDSLRRSPTFRPILN